MCYMTVLVVYIPLHCFSMANEEQSITKQPLASHCARKYWIKGLMCSARRCDSNLVAVSENYCL